MNLSCGAIEGGTNAFAGYIDDVRISNTDRSAAFNTSSTTYTYNNANQLTGEVSGLQTKTYTYDQNGNNTSVATSVNSVARESVAMTYDSLNRMTNWSDGTNSEATAYRGAAWHRTSTTVTKDTATPITTKYLYNGDDVVGDYSNNVQVASYVTPSLDGNVSLTTGGQTYFYTQDGLGSIRTLSNSAGIMQNKYDYNAFGTKFEFNSISSVNNRYTYTGREKSSLTDAPIYYRYRFYVPMRGRFISKDPIGYIDDQNLYTYVYNSPNLYSDPRGLYKFKIKESACIIKMEFKIQIVGWNNLSKVQGRLNKTRQKRFKRKLKEVIEKTFNNSVYRIYPAKGSWNDPSGTGCCPCYKNGFKPELDVTVTDRWTTTDDIEINVYNGKDTGDHSWVSGDRETGSLMYTDIEYGVWLSNQTAAVHEFGHMIDLDHPGRGMVDPKTQKVIPPNSSLEYKWNQNDIFGHPVNGPTDLMGEGMGLQPFYFDKWKLELDKNFSKCSPFVTK